jgi:hypothetical protein
MSLKNTASIHWRKPQHVRRRQAVLYSPGLDLGRITREKPQGLQLRRYRRQALGYSLRESRATFARNRTNEGGSTSAAARDLSQGPRRRGGRNIERQALTELDVLDTDGPTERHQGPTHLQNEQNRETTSKAYPAAK